MKQAYLNSSYKNETTGRQPLSRSQLAGTRRYHCQEIIEGPVHALHNE